MRSPSEQPSDLRPWDRQPGEREGAYQAFLAYRESGPPRNLAATARVLHKHEAQLYRWKERHSWEARLLAWDAAQGRESEERRQREGEQRRRRWGQASDHLLQALLSNCLEAIS